MKSITFDDVLLRPRYSEVTSRSQVSTKVVLKAKNFELEFAHPIIPANMKDIVSLEVAEVFYKQKALCLLHRFDSVLEKKKFYVDELKKLGPDVFNYIGFSIGVQKEDYQHALELIDLGVKIICIDVAHAHSKIAGDLVKFLSDKDILLIAGNVATDEGAEFLHKQGADVVKVNVGAGSICTTRVQTGCGVPQLSALMEVHKYQDFVKKSNSFKMDKRTFSIIADGGMSQPGHMVIALGFSDMVMTGNMLAGCIETPGKMNGGLKEYSGSSTHKDKFIEGVKAFVEEKGSIDSVVESILDGVKSGCSYQGVFSVPELKEVVGTSMREITTSSLKESRAHDVVIKS